MYEVFMKRAVKGFHLHVLCVFGQGHYTPCCCEQILCEISAVSQSLH